MAIHANTLPVGEPVYSYVAEDGTNIHIHSGRLRQWCIDNEPPVHIVPVDQLLAASFLEDNVVSLARIQELAKRPNLDPIIFAKEGYAPLKQSLVMMVDGHHRYVLTALRSQLIIPAYIVEEHQWRPFEVIGRANFTQQQLRDLPITKRSY